MYADAAELRRIYAQEYVQYDDRGEGSTRGDLISKLTSANTRFLSMVSNARVVRMLSDTVAIVPGSGEDEIERDGAQIVSSVLIYGRGDEAGWRVADCGVTVCAIVSLIGLGRCLTADSVLPMTPDKIYNCSQKHESNHRVQFVEVLR
jgi:hypothetical protein